MIEKWYEVTCDYCGTVMNHYIDKKPSKKELVVDGFVVYKSLIFCSEECLNQYKSKFCPPYI